MTALELRAYFNKEYGIHKEWPKTFEVDLETYNNVKIAIEKWEEEHHIHFDFKGKLIYKGVELILKQ